MIGETTSLPDPSQSQPVKSPEATTEVPTDTVKAKEIGGRDGLDPTRYGDWEKNGRCIDF